MDIETIHESLVNDQRKQMVKQIDRYGVYDFWADYKAYLLGVYTETSSILDYFADAVISYHRIKNR